MKLIPNTTDLSGMDCHMHSLFSPDSHQTPEQIVSGIKKRGLRGFIITDHIDVDRWWRDLDFEEYFRVWNKVRAAHPELKIYIGLEVGFEPETAERTYRLIKDLPLEYVINSVHYVTRPDNPYYDSYAGGRISAYTDYINAVIASLDAPWEFNTVGHFGFFERYAPPPKEAWVMDYQTFKPLMDEVIRKIVSRGARVEENTNGGSEFRLPRADFLRAYKAAGGMRPVISSDAHTPDMIANRFSEAEKFIDEIFNNA